MSSRLGFPKFKVAQLVPAGEIDSGTIHGSPRQTTTWGVPFPILEGKYDVLVTAETGRPVALVKNLEVVPGGTAVVKTNDEIAAIVVRPEATEDLEIETIRVFKHGSNYYIRGCRRSTDTCLCSRRVRRRFEAAEKPDDAEAKTHSAARGIDGCALNGVGYGIFNGDVSGAGSAGRLANSSQARRLRPGRRRCRRRPGSCASRRHELAKDPPRPVGVGDRRRGRRCEAKHNVERPSTAPDRLEESRATLVGSGCVDLQWNHLKTK